MLDHSEIIPYRAVRGSESELRLQVNTIELLSYMSDRYTRPPGTNFFQNRFQNCREDGMEIDINRE